MNYIDVINKEEHLKSCTKHTISMKKSHYNAEYATTQDNNRGSALLIDGMLMTVHVEICSRVNIKWNNHSEYLRLHCD